MVVLDAELTAQDIKGETRLAITTHESADVGVCLTNTYECGFPAPFFALVAVSCLSEAIGLGEDWRSHEEGADALSGTWGTA